VGELDMVKMFTGRSRHNSSSFDGCKRSNGMRAAAGEGMLLTSDLICINPRRMGKWVNPKTIIFIKHYNLCLMGSLVHALVNANNEIQQGKWYKPPPPANVLV
jgi:hypothetical protein